MLMCACDVSFPSLLVRVVSASSVLFCSSLLLSPATTTTTPRTLHTPHSTHTHIRHTKQYYTEQSLRGQSPSDNIPSLE